MFRMLNLVGGGVILIGLFYLFGAAPEPVFYIGVCFIATLLPALFTVGLIYSPAARPFFIGALFPSAAMLWFVPSLFFQARAMRSYGGSGGDLDSMRIFAAVMVASPFVTGLLAQGFRAYLRYCAQPRAVYKPPPDVKFDDVLRNG